MNNPKDNKDVTAEMDDALWIKDISIEDDVLAGVYEVPAGIAVELGDIPKGTTRVIGEGTVNCGSELPSDSLGWTNATWEGTIAFNGLSGDACKAFRFELYGNANSKIQLTNCSIPYLNNNNATFAGTLILLDDEGHNAAFSTEDGYSGNYNVFGALEGDGSMSFANGQRQGYVFLTATNYTGGISIEAENNNGTVGGRRIVFGNVTDAADLPTTSASITVKSGATASIGANATWNAGHGVEIAGTLLVKGANATLDRNADGTLGLKLVGGATLRFDSSDAKLTFAKAPVFASGTVKIAFGAGVKPVAGATLIDWSAGGTAPGGSFEFEDASLSQKWELTKGASGLTISVIKPADSFDIPGTSSFIPPGDAEVETWLANDEIYQELLEWNDGDYPWQDYFAETGFNGYKNWMNFLLGFPADDSSAKFSVTIEIVNGEVVVRTNDSVPSGYLDVVIKRLYSKESLDGQWPAEGDVINGTVKAVPLAPGARFYKVKVDFE